MSETVMSILLVAAIVGTGLVGGLFFAFSNFIMAALGRVKPAAGIAAMQAINATVINPLFMLVFFGSGLVTLLVAAGAVAGWGGAPLWAALSAALLYNIGCLGVTMRCNVPRNTALAKADEGTPEAAALWSRYLKEWTFWNHVRTVASLAPCAVLVLGVI